MATIATLTLKTDGNLEGTLATLNVTAPIALVPNVRKAKDNEPDYPSSPARTASNSVPAGTGSRRTRARNTSRSASPRRSSARSTATWHRHPATTRRRRSSSGTPPTDLHLLGPAIPRGTGLVWAILTLPDWSYCDVTHLAFLQSCTRTTLVGLSVLWDGSAFQLYVYN